MSSDTSNTPCTTQIGVHNSEKVTCVDNANIERLSINNQLLKVFILRSKEYQLNICAILQDMNSNFSTDKIEEYMNTVDYDCIKNRQIELNENLKLDLLIYGCSKREIDGTDLVMMVNEQYPLTDLSRQAVCRVSRQLMESINTVINTVCDKKLLFCIECGMQLRNENDCIQHVNDHKWVWKDKGWEKEYNHAVVLQNQYNQNNKCIVNRFNYVDWLGMECEPFFISTVQNIILNKDIDRSKSSPPLSMLPSWTTATSPICLNCDVIFESAVELEEHTQLNHQTLNRCTNRSIISTAKEYKCSICNYKTVTKGNLHIHFQSEKHRNNQREHDHNEHKDFIACQNSSSVPTLPPLPQLNVLDSLISRSQNCFFSNIKPNSFSSNWPAIQTNHYNAESSTIGLPIDVALNNMATFKCEICQTYYHSDIETILEHADRPRHLPSNSEVSKVVKANIDGAELEHVCMLDGYKTRIKANFLLHFKTEKHQQKLQLLAHANEGGIENANKVMLQMVTEQTSLISIHCNLCRATFSTAHKLRLHSECSDHQINQKIANSYHLWKKTAESNHNLKNEKQIAGFECKPCGSVFRHYVDVLNHFNVQRDIVHMTVSKQEIDINNLIKIHYYNKLDKPEFVGNDNFHPEKSEIPSASLFKCKLCNENVDRKELKFHLKDIHKIQEYYVDQLVNLAEKVQIENLNKILPLLKWLKISNKPEDWCDCVIVGETDKIEPMVRCQQCGKCFANVSLLEEHKTTVKHGDVLDQRGHLCYKKGCNQYFKSFLLMVDHFYEIHAFQIQEYKQLEPFKYVCKICHLLAFKCTIKYYQHMNSHSLFKEFDCVVCGLSTEGRTDLRKHIERHHVINVDNELIESPDSLKAIKSQYGLMPNSSSMLSKMQGQHFFGSSESIVNKENRNHFDKTNQYQNLIEKNNLTPNSDFLTNRANSLTPISSLISTVGLENVKLVIETMINSKYKQNDDDSTVWKYAESIIDIANIKETLVEKCKECEKTFSSQEVLKKHIKICSNPSSEILKDFEHIVSVCREHLTKMMMTYCNDIARKQLFGPVKTYKNEKFKEIIPSQPQQLKNILPCDEFLNINRMPPIINSYRIQPNNHNFINILPPLGMFPMTKLGFGNLNSSNEYKNYSVFNSKPPLSNSNVDHYKFASDTIQKTESLNRKRTQIKNHQYDILWSHFNINNPPNDETIIEIIEKTGLDKKTVKHWFRNTLFKERQRCKDSPYNFNIPPETSLNLEEYEKTGKIEIKSECSRTSSPIDKIKNSDDAKTDESSEDYRIEYNKRSSEDFGTEPLSSKFRRVMENGKEASEINKADSQINIGNDVERIKNFKNLDENSMINIKIIKDKINVICKRDSTLVSNSPPNEDTPLDLSYQSSGFNILNSSRNSVNFEPISPFESELEPIENCSSNFDERRHRTTLTAMQIQAMKSIFIHCRSPSHNELGMLGNILSLDMRVVQVWFQNQRAKLKKQERDVFHREKPVFPEAVQSIVELSSCDRFHCLVCNQNLSLGVSKQAHLFSNDHLVTLMRHLVTKSSDMKLNWKSGSDSL